MRIVVATYNAKKAGEMATILGRLVPGVSILTLADFPPTSEPDETGSTYAENAAIKAEAAARHTGELCLADDAGLEIDALGGEPGLYSRRFAGEDTPFPEKMAILLERLADVPDEGRTARFRCAVAAAEPQSGGGIRLLSFQADCEGRIARSPAGSGGFGYDPIFYLPQLGRTMAELTADEKHAVSHRGKVLAEVAEWLISRTSRGE